VSNYRTTFHPVTLLLAGACAVLTGAAAAGTWSAGSVPIRSSASTTAAVARAPLSFEPASGGGFLARGAGSDVALKGDTLTLATRRQGTARQRPERATVRLRLLGARKDAVGVGEAPMRATSSYFIGRDRSRWRRDVPNYSRVRFARVYPGIDAVYYGRDGSLEYDFVVAPGTDPGAVRLGLEGAAGRPTIDAAGTLRVPTPGGEMTQPKPVAYQEVDGARKQVACSYDMTSTGPSTEVVTFRLGEYDRARPLVIDPVLRYFTDETALTTGIAVDGEGFLYVTGTAGNPDGFDTMDDVFVRKFNPTGTELVYTFYFGGEDFDQSGGITIDASGAAYVTGYTWSTQFPVSADAYQRELAWTPDPESPDDRPATTDAFCAKVSPDGSALVYATYLGGHWIESDFTWGSIAVDREGHAFVAGTTESADFPTTAGSLKPSRSGDESGRAEMDGFLVKLNKTGSQAEYATYFGGASGDLIFGVAVDAEGYAAIGGGTASPDLATEGAFQSASPDGYWGDGFVSRLAPGGDRVVWTTYLAGNGSDLVRGVAMDGAGNIYAAGETVSPNFPTVDPFQRSIAGEAQLDEYGGTTYYHEDGFVAKFAPTGEALYSTYLGGSDQEIPLAITVDGEGRAVLTGRTESPDFPTVVPDQPGIGMLGEFATTDAFVTKVEADGRSLFYSTFLGSDLADEGRGVAVNAAGDVFIAGNSIAGEFGYLSATRRAVPDGVRRSTPRPLATDPTKVRPFVSRLRDPKQRPMTLAKSRSIIRYGSVPAGQAMRRKLRFWNMGGGILKGQVGSATGSFRVVRGGGAYVLRPGQWRWVVVEFAPAAAGRQTGRLTLENRRPQKRLAHVKLEGSGG
jgi:hypothetical protein